MASLLKIANGFKAQLNELSEITLTPESSKEIQERFAKALNYYKKEVEAKILEP